MKNLFLSVFLTLVISVPAFALPIKQSVKIGNNQYQVLCIPPMLRIQKADGTSKSFNPANCSPVSSQDETDFQINEIMSQLNLTVTNSKFASISVDTMVPTPPSSPNVSEFVGSLIADNSIPNTAHASLAAYFGILVGLVSSPAALQLEWSRLVAVDTTLALACTDNSGQTVQQRVEQYATANHIPLVHQ